MAEVDHIVADRLPGLDDLLRADRCLPNRHGGIHHPDRPPDGGSHVGDDGISAHLRHLSGLLRRSDINDGEEVHAACQPDHINLLLHTHAGLLQNLPELSIHNGVGGKIVHSAETHVPDLPEKVPHAPPRIAPVHTTDNRDLLHHGKNFKLPDFHRHGIGVAVGHEARGGAVPRHAEATGIIDDNEVSPSFFDKFGADSSAGSCRDNGLPTTQAVLQPFDHFFARVGISFSSPGIRHRFRA